MPALPGVPLTAIPATSAPNADLPATQFPSLTRIGVVEKVGPPVANRQVKSLEKRDETMRSLINSLIAAVNAIDANYVRLDGGNTLTHDIPAGGHTWTGLRDAAANDEPVTLGQLGGTSSSLAAEIAARIAGDNALNSSKAPLASPALTGSPTAPTQTVHDNTTKLATTAFVVAEIKTLPPSAWLFVAGSASPVLHIDNTAGATDRAFEVVGVGGGSGGVIGGLDWFGMDGGVSGDSGAYARARIVVPAGGNADFYCGVGGAYAPGTGAHQVAGGDTQVVVSDGSGCIIPGGQVGAVGSAPPVSRSFPTASGSAMLVEAMPNVAGTLGRTAYTFPPTSLNMSGATPIGGSGGKGSTGGVTPTAGVDGWIRIQEVTPG